MSDDADLASEVEQFNIEVMLKRTHDAAVKFDPGKQGECDFCGEFFARIVRVEWLRTNANSCARCRDLRGIK